MSNYMINLHEPNFDKKDLSYLTKCLESGWVSTSGDYIEKFEYNISKYTGSKFSIACINGTSALQIALKLADVSDGDEVMVPSLTFVASVNAIKYNQAEPIFLDNDNNYTLDIDKILEFLKNETIPKIVFTSKGKVRITINKKTKKRIKALMIVHTFGNAVNIEKIIKICKEKNISIVEDAAESLGTFYNSGKYKNRHTGTVGLIGCLSFNGNKIITAGGGGMILTNDSKIASKARYLISQAKNDSLFYVHDEIGYNYKLNNLQASLGLSQFYKLDSYLKNKKKIHNRYKLNVNKISYLRITQGPIYSSNNHWLNILEIDRDLNERKFKKIIKEFHKNNIGVRPLWKPNHLQKIYLKNQQYKLKYINEIYFKRICLPSSPNLTIKDQNFICSKIAKILI